MDIQKFNKLLTRTRPEELSTLEREQLWRQVTERSSGARFMPRMALFTTPLSRTAIVGSCVAALLYGGALTVYASDDAVPGDLLFPVDTLVEQLQVVVTPREQRDQLRVKFSEERLREVEHVLNEVDDDAVLDDQNDDQSSGQSGEPEVRGKSESREERLSQVVVRAQESLEESEAKIEDDDRKDEVRKIRREVEELHERKTKGKRKGREKVEAESRWNSEAQEEKSGSSKQQQEQRASGTDEVNIEVRQNDTSESMNDQEMESETERRGGNSGKGDEREVER